MKHLDLILLFIFSFFFTQGRVFVASSTFDRNLFPLYFLFILVYLLISIREFKSSKLKNKLKLIIFAFIVLLTVGKTTYTAINLRHQLNGEYPVYDNVIQIEEAVKFLKQGKNPYTEIYHGTALEEWFNCDDCSLRNSLWHVVTLPFYLFSSLVVSIPAQGFIGYFDTRFMHIITFLISLWIIHKLIKPVEQKIIFLTLFIFNPIQVHYFIDGRNDIFVFGLVLLAIYLLYKKNFLWSSLVLGLAFASKQSSWLILPFYFSYLYFQNLPKKNIKPKLIRSGITTLKQTWPFFLIVAIFFIPFLISDAHSFIQDIYYYPGGSLPTSFPITGIGISHLLLEKGYLENDMSYFPTWLFQLIFGIPLLIYLLIQQFKKNTITNLVFGYTAFLLVFWLFSRFLMENYIAYLSMLLITAMMFHEVETKKS